MSWRRLPDGVLCPRVGKPIRRSLDQAWLDAHEATVTWANGVQLYPYRCPFCEGWHLTRSKKFDEVAADAPAADAPPPKWLAELQRTIAARQPL